MDGSATLDGTAILSPLRYPGAKRRLAGYVAEVLRYNAVRPRLLVEPFAGGASVALQLLNADVVDSIALGERDPWVASFWKTVFREPEWLIEQVATIEVTLEAWDYYRSNHFRRRREQALACLFLNRTSFSGILSPSAGPIGGRSQTSENRIDCRFNRRTIAERIRRVARLGQRVAFVDRADWRQTFAKVGELGLRDDEVFFYVDPPFFEKSSRLYRFGFAVEDHKALHDSLMETRQWWLLSYDPAEAIQELYRANGTPPKRVELLYSASVGDRLVEAEELVITNLPRLPVRTKLWCSRQEHRVPRLRKQAQNQAATPQGEPHEQHLFAR